MCSKIDDTRYSSTWATIKTSNQNAWVVKLIEDLHSLSFLLNVQTNSWCIFTLVNKFGAGVVEVKKSTGIEKTTSAGKTCNSKKYLLSTEGSSKQACLPPEVTSRSRDVNKDGGQVNDLPHPYPLIKYVNDLLNMQIYANDLLNMQIIFKFNTLNPFCLYTKTNMAAVRTY